MTTPAQPNAVDMTILDRLDTIEAQLAELLAIFRQLQAMADMFAPMLGSNPLLKGLLPR